MEDLLSERAPATGGAWELLCSGAPLLGAPPLGGGFFVTGSTSVQLDQFPAPQVYSSIIVWQYVAPQVLSLPTLREIIEVIAPK